MTQEDKERTIMITLCDSENEIFTKIFDKAIRENTNCSILYIRIQDFENKIYELIDFNQTKRFDLNAAKETENGIEPFHRMCTRETLNTIANIIFQEIHPMDQETYSEENDKWNVISKDNMPPIGVPLIVTVKDLLQGLGNELRYPVYYEKDPMKEGYHFSHRYGDMTYEIGLKCVTEIIAWQEFPKIYQKEKQG